MMSSSSSSSSSKSESPPPPPLPPLPPPPSLPTSAPKAMAMPTPSPTRTTTTTTRRRRQTITDLGQVTQAQEDCQFNSGNNVISCFPTADTVVPQQQWASFVWNSRRPELTQTNLVDIFLFRADSQQQLLHFPNTTNPPDRAGLVTAQVNDTWFGADGLKFAGKNVSFPYYWVIIRSDATLANGNFIPQPIFTAVQTQVLDSVAAAASSSSVAAALSSSSALAASLSSVSAHLSSSASGSSPSSTSTTGTGTGAGNVQHSSSGSSFPRWAIAVIVVLGFLAIAATCILVFVVLRRIRRRRQSSGASSRNSMGSASPMMPRDPDMIQRYDSAGSPLLAPAAAGALGGAALGGGGGSSHHHGGGSVTHDGASAISDSGGPFSGADAAIMADAFRKMLRKPDFAGRPVEEGESPEQLEGNNEEGAAGNGGEVLRGQLAEEGRDIRSVSSSRGVTVQSGERERERDLEGGDAGPAERDR